MRKRYRIVCLIGALAVAFIIGWYGSNIHQTSLPADLVFERDFVRIVNEHHGWEDSQPLHSRLRVGMLHLWHGCGATYLSPIDLTTALSGYSLYSKTPVYVFKDIATLKLEPFAARGRTYGRVMKQFESILTSNGVTFVKEPKLGILVIPSRRSGE